MDFGLNDEQLTYQAECRKFAREVIRPAAPKHDREESTPWEVIKEARRQGFGGLEGMQRAAEDDEGQMQPIMAEAVPLGLRRDRPGDQRLRPRRRRASPPPAPPSRRCAGSPSASATPRR